MMFLTSKMVLNKSLSSIRGKSYHSAFMGTSDDNSYNATADTSDIQVTRGFMKDAYKTSDWIRAIVDRGAERASQVEVFPIPLGAKLGTKEGKLNSSVRRRMEDVMKLFMKPNSDKESFRDLSLKVFRDVLVYDEAGIQIVSAKNALGEDSPYGLYCNVSGEELYVNPNKNGTLPDLDAYVQLRNGSQKVAAWDKHEMMNFIRNKRAGYANGMSPIETLASAIIGDLESMNFNLKFFQNNARPDIAFIFENLGFGKGNVAIDRAKTWYLNNHQGKPHLPLFMGSEKGQVKLQELKYTHRDMQFLEWQDYLLSRILSVYGCRSISMGLASSTEAMAKIDSAAQGDEFKRNLIQPLLSMFIGGINSGLIWDDYNFNYDDVYVTCANLDIDDESKQADIDETYLDRGVITINQVRNRRQMPPVPWGNLPFVPLNYAPYDTLVEYQRSKIQSNIKSAMSDKIDNNIKVEGADKKKAKDVDEEVKKEMALWDGSTMKGLMGIYSALYDDGESDGNIAHWMPDLSKSLPPTGLEGVDTTEVLGIVEKLIRDRDAKISKAYSFSSELKSTHSTINSLGLSWTKILKRG